MNIFLNVFQIFEILLFAAKEPVQVTDEDTDAVHRRFVKEPAANIKDGVTEPSKVSTTSKKLCEVLVSCSAQK